MDLAEVVSGSPMTFFQWSIFGVPVMIIFTAVSAWCLPRYFKPDSLTTDQTAEIEKMFASIPEKLNKKDWSYIVITCIMMVFWIASNWVSILDVATVAIGGMFLMMLPGIDLLSAKDYKRNISPMVILIMLCMFPLAAGMGSTGAGQWMIDKIFVDSGGWSLVTMYIMATIAAFLVHLLIPQGSANGALSAAIIAPVCIAAGIPAATALMIVGVQAGTGFLFPIEGVWSQTFGYGHYRFEDCLKGCWPIQLTGMVMCITLIPLLSMLFSAMGLIK
jgi:sodium-dependent dicarboxylate transporter 2/3/5